MCATWTFSTCTRSRGSTGFICGHLHAAQTFAPTDRPTTHLPEPIFTLNKLKRIRQRICGAEELNKRLFWGKAHTSTIYCRLIKCLHMSSSCKADPKSDMKGTSLCLCRHSKAVAGLRRSGFSAWFIKLVAILLTPESFYTLKVWILFVEFRVSALVAVSTLCFLDIFQLDAFVPP